LYGCLDNGSRDEVASQRNKLVIGVLLFCWKCLSVWSSIQRAENMSEGAVPITEEIEELKKKLALLGKP